MESKNKAFVDTVTPDVLHVLLFSRKQPLNSADDQYIGKFYILETVHLGIILINNHLNAHFLLYVFILILYTFRATLCSSPGQPIVSIQHLVYVTLCR